MKVVTVTPDTTTETADCEYCKHLLVKYVTLDGDVWEHAGDGCADPEPVACPRCETVLTYEDGCACRYADDDHWLDD
jgi:hypothetical protein